jgi:hypothetical protein
VSETKESKSTVSIRPQPGQTELNWREWLMLLGVIVVAVVICTYGGRAVIRSFAAAPTTPTATPTRVRPTVTLAPSPTPVQPTATPTPDIPTDVATGVYVTVIDGVNFPAGGQHYGADHPHAGRGRSAASDRRPGVG